MESEHDEAGELLEVIKHITHNVTPPPEACTTRKAMYNGINEMIDDLMEHISPKIMCCSRAPSAESKKRCPRAPSTLSVLFGHSGWPFYDGPLQATLKFSFISPAVFAGKQPARAQQHKPQRVTISASRVSSSVVNSTSTKTKKAMHTQHMTLPSGIL